MVDYVLPVASWALKNGPPLLGSCLNEKSPELANWFNKVEPFSRCLGDIVDAIKGLITKDRVSAVCNGASAMQKLLKLFLGV